MTIPQIPLLDIERPSQNPIITLTPRTKSAICEYANSLDDVSIVLNLEFYKNLDKKHLEFYFTHITPHTKDIFRQAVNKGEEELTKKILKLLSDLINIKVMSTEILILTPEEILDYLAFESELSGEGFFKGVD
ncbi:MAG: hypothetical protein RCO49_07430 [Rickettsia endosymbiont of Argas persicus]